MGYTKEAIKGISWVGAFRLSTRFITLLRTAILARILSPAQFGVFGIASLLLGLVEMLTETGINVFLVQEADDAHKYLNTAWMVSIMRGILISAVIILSAGLVSNFFNSPDSYNLLLLMSLVPFIRGFINPAVVKFQKDLQFNKEFWFRFTVFAIDSFTTIILAFLTRSTASLIWGFIAGAIAEVVLSFVVMRPTPKVIFELEKAKRIFSRGKWMTAAGIFNYLFYNGDNIVVGRLLGLPSLGIYQMGYRISTIPISEVADVVSRVTFPVYVKIAGDSSRLRRAFTKTIIVISLICIPFGLILFVFPEQIVKLLLGDQWLDVIPLLRILAIFGIIRAISTSTSSVFLALKKQEYVTVLTLFGILGLGISIVPLINQYGIVGASMAAFVGSIAALPPIFYYTWKVFSNKKEKNNI